MINYEGQVIAISLKEEEFDEAIEYLEKGIDAVKCGDATRAQLAMLICSIAAGIIGETAKN